MNALLLAGDSIRSVARIFGIPKTSLTRHAAHIAPVDRRPRVVPPPPIDLAPVDPLAEAMSLAQRARTQRQRLKALEQIRSATALVLRRMDSPDEEQLGRLDRNLADAEEAYRDQDTFEEAVRALQGIREAIRQRLDAVKPGTIEIPAINVTFFDAAEGPPSETPADDPKAKPFYVTVEQYFRDVPKRFRDATRYVVERRIQLHFDRDKPTVTIKVRDAAGVLAWAND